MFSTTILSPILSVLRHIKAWNRKTMGLLFLARVFYWEYLMGDHRLEEWLSFLSLNIIIFDVFVLKMFLYSSNSILVWSSLLSSLLLSLISHHTMCLNFSRNQTQLLMGPWSGWDRDRPRTSFGNTTHHSSFLNVQSIQTWNTDTRQICEDTRVCLSSACSLSIAWLTLQESLFWMCHPHSFQS